MKRIFASILALCLGLFVSGQGIGTFSASSAIAGEISHDSAKSKAVDFRSKIDDAADSFSKSEARIIRTRSMSANSFASKQQFWVHIDTKSGRVRAAYNMKRRIDQYRGRNRNGASRFASEAEAKKFVRALATRLGVPATAELDLFGWKKDGEVKDANKAGVIWGSYSDPNTGSYSVNVDPQDGAFISLIFTPKR